MTTKTDDVRTPPKPKRPAPAKKPAKPAGRPVIHRDVKVQLCVGEFALSVDQSKELMGWTTDAEVAKKAGLDEPLLHDLNKQPVWCLNNVHNRPLYMETVEALIQEHLMRRWRFNGEPIIIGETGIVENGQHQLTAHILAEQHRLIDGEGKQWLRHWPGPVTMEKVVIYGIKETDDVINTMDTCKPRSFTDVIFRSNLFGKTKGRDLKILARMLDSCVRLLWQRTGAVVDAFAPRRTHSEGMDFIGRHPHAVQAVKHIWDEYKGGTYDSASKNWQVNNQRLGAGYAAALCYLMGASATDGTEYVSQKVPSEKKVDWEHWDLAKEFWTRFSSGHEEMGALHKTLGYLVDPETNVGGTLAERLAIIIKAWHLYQAGEPMSVKALSIEDLYKENDAGVRRMGRGPSIGGVDQGDSKGTKAPDAEVLPGGGDPTPEQIEAQRKQIKDDGMRRKAEGRKPEPTSNGNPTPPVATPPKKTPPRPKKATPTADAPAE